MQRQFYPGYSIGPQAYADISAVCTRYGSTAAIIGGRRALAAAEEKIKGAAHASGIHTGNAVWYGGEASIENIEALREMPQVAAADMLFAVGGGKAIDTVKVLAQTTGKPFFTFPTIASTCAACTSLGILYHPDGSLREYSFSKAPPEHIFIDSAVIAGAPREYLWAGIGDTMAKFYECTVSGRGDTLGFGNAMGTAISTMCADPLVKHGVQALADCDAGAVSEELEEAILSIVVATGFVSNLVDIDYNTGMAHAIYNGCTILPEVAERHLHGEVVAYGILVLLTADGQLEERDRIFRFNRDMGLPTCLADIEADPASLDRVIEKALQGIDVRHYPYPVTAQMIRTAILELENYAAEQKNIA